MDKITFDNKEDATSTKSRLNELKDKKYEILRQINSDEEQIKYFQLFLKQIILRLNFYM